ncbi:hypothetical protein HAX54_020904 [Datura stramonium]|uniref:Uncharacterized protein n=1 Tax=Datura stramonium TaxID=4076 RepID=A0ABS8S2Y8_DATST|nr:hypothetical protein [Datura stramonium]
MDFHSLTRRELQALCKKNKIPANMTNVSMADALQSLEFVDGIEEVLKPCESDVANSSMESPGKSEALTSVPQTGRRTTQRKTIKHDSETLETSTRSHCRTRGTAVRDADEAKNDMHETPALPTTRRRAATTSVRAKLESVMKECEPKEKIGYQDEEEKKDVPKTPAAALTSQRKEVKAKSSVRQVYSTRRSVRLAGKSMQESSTQEDEKSGGTLTFDAVSEETDESLEVDYVHKTEELNKNGIDLKSSESLDIKNESDTVTGQDSNTLVQNEIHMEDGVQQDNGNDLVVVALDTKAKEGSEEGSLGQNNNGGSEEVSGAEPIEESEIDAEAKKEEEFLHKNQSMGDDSTRNSDITNVVLIKQLHEQDEPHCGDTTDFVEENDGEGEDNFNQMFECQMDEGAECNSDVAGKQELIGEPVSVNPDTKIHFHEVNLFEQFNSEVETKVRASQKKCLTNMQANIDSLEVSLFEQFNVEVDAKVSGNQQKCQTTMEDAGEEEPIEEYDVDCTEANVDAPADALEFAGEEEPMEEFEVDYAEATVDAPADALEVAGEEEPMEEYDDRTEANVDAPADSLEVPGEESMEKYDVFCTEANVDAPADVFEVDYAEATVESAAHNLPPLPLIPDAAQEGECEVKVSVSETNTEVAGEEPMEEFEIDHAEANMDTAHALPSPASLIPNAAPEPVFTLALDHMQNPYALASTNPELITQTPLENSSEATSIGQILVSDNKENLVCMKENKGTSGNNKQPLENLSLRKLTKMLKDLKISKDPSGKEAAISRSALQILPKDSLTSENTN